MADVLSHLHSLADRYLAELGADDRAVVLGRGGMATVYLVRDLRHGRRVALKVLHPELSASLGPERFLREIALAARLTHPNILPLFDSGTADGLLYYTMPYVAGESLRGRIKRDKQLPLEVALAIAQQVLAALGYAHAQGIVHRDIKPENILLEEGQAVVADFGLARAIGSAAGEHLTETGLTLGTPTYMSPEQAAGGQDLDGRSDIYSFATVLYELLAGEPPFVGATAQAIIARRFKDPVPRLRTVRETVPPRVEEAIDRALAKVPADRFATAADFARALESGKAAGARRFTVPVRHRVMAVGLLAAAVAGGFLVSRAPAPTPLDRNLLAVAPFDVLEPSLDLWREGLVDILSRNLDGAGPVRTVSPSVGLRRWKGRGDKASAEEFGRRIGAALIVFGSVIAKGNDSVSLRGTVLDVGRAEAYPDFEVLGPTAQMGVLADSLGLEVLRALGRTHPIASVRQVSLGARSLPALKAFLRGEQFYRLGLWDSALPYYDRALSADSGFALAFRRMAAVLSWYPQSSGAYRPPWEYLLRSVVLNHGLSPRESLLIAADSLGFAAYDETDPARYLSFRFREIGALEEAARRYPRDPEVWYVLGERRTHDPPPVGGFPAPALEAFERAIALDPGFAPAYQHLVGLTLTLGRPEAARRYASTYLQLDPTGKNASSVRLTTRLLDPELARQPDMALLIDTAAAGDLYDAGCDYLAFWPDSAETAVRLVRAFRPGRNRVTGASPWVADSLMWRQYLAQALAFRGRLHEAYEVSRRLLLDADASPWVGISDPFLSLSLLGVIPDSVADGAFNRSLQPGAPWHSDLAPRHLRGLPWWLTRRDTASLVRFAERAAKEAGRPETALSRLRARHLGAVSAGYLALARGDSADALVRLDAIPDSLCLATHFTASCFYAKLTLARLLEARGDDRRARDLLDHWRWDAGNDPFFAIATLERGRIDERLGERERALEAYRFVADVWHRADPELRPFLAEARDGLARLARR